MGVRISRATYFKFCENCGCVTPHQLEGFLGRGTKYRFRCMTCNFSLLENLTGRMVTVRNCGVQVKGKLLAVSSSNTANHKPEILLLETDGGPVVVRGWQILIFERRHKGHG